VENVEKCGIHDFTLVSTVARNIDTMSFKNENMIVNSRNIT